jgi:hypothetical protein
LLRAFSNRAALAALVIVGLSPSAEGQFVDQTISSALLSLSPSWGAIFADVDGDGDLDLYAGRHASLPVLYGNDGTGRFNPIPMPWTEPVDRHGGAILSLDEDDDPDIFVTHGGAGGSGSEPNELYRNDGSGEFVSVAASAGLDDPDGRSRAVAAADFDGDHRVDLWVGKAPRAQSPNSLYRNDGTLMFTDVAATVGLDEGLGTVGGLWGDVDDDGDPDLLVGGEEFARPTVLYRNDGGSFADVSSIFAPALPVISGADFGDMDGDDDLDLAVCDGSVGLFDVFTEGDSVTFYFNTRWADDGVDGLTIPSTADTLFARLRIRGFDDPDLVFLGPDEINPPPSIPMILTDEYVGAPAFTPGVDRGIWVWRTAPAGAWEMRCSTPLLNQDAFDGWFEDGSPLSGVVAHNLEDPGFVPGGPRVWRNDGGAFTEVTTALGLPMMLNPRDISWVDYDNDGDLDLHVVDMGTSATLNAPDALFRNDGAVFSDVTSLEGVEGGVKGLGDGAVWGDVDRDGDLDVYVQQGAGPLAFSFAAPSLFLENEGPRGNSIQIDLVGRASGAPAIGARVTAHLGRDVVRRRVSANAWRGFADPLTVHLGLGGALGADSLTIEWPAGGVEVYRPLAAGQYRIKEGREVTSLDILTASPDSLAPTQTGALDFEVRDSTSARVSGEATNFTLTSLGGLLIPEGPAVENADSTYTISYASQLATGVDTLVVTDPLSAPPLSDSLEVRITVYPDTIRLSSDGPPRVHWSDSLVIRVSILDPNGNRLLDEGTPFTAVSLQGLGSLSGSQSQSDSSYTLGYAASAGAGLAVDTLVVWDPETVSVDRDSLAVELTDTAIIDSIVDVEDDQGGEVRVTWQRDLHDTTAAATPITHYTVLRRMPGGGWETVGPTVPASAQETYTAIFPTSSDSTGFFGIPWQVYYVSAHTAVPEVFFDSAPDSGYSVDNLAPGPPGPVTFVTPDRIEWVAPVDTNYVNFRVYASEDSDFDPETDTALGMTVDTAWEPVNSPFAFVTARDAAGNESTPSGAANPTPTPEVTAPHRSFLSGGRPNPFRSTSRIDFGIREDGVARLVVYDVRGRRVRVLHQGFVAAGRHFELWNGMDHAGRRVAPGVYFVRLESGAFRSTRKLVRLR